jgi:glycosyltransferase involved in cell wall biosynthesis
MASITVGVLCYNEEKLIGPCVDSIAPHVDRVVITDGTMFGSIPNDEDMDQRCSPSTDRTPLIIRSLVQKHNNVISLDWHDVPRMPEKDVRNFQLVMCVSDWFMIVDVDEIWDEPEIMRLHHFLDNTKDQDFTVKCRNFFYNPNTFIDQRLKRVFRDDAERRFYGNNEMQREKYSEMPDDIFFYHYGFIDAEKVKARCEIYGGDYYKSCGPWWFENIYSAYDGTNFDELCKKNGGVFHIFGKRFPGYGNWRLVNEEVEHPEIMREYLEGLGHAASYRHIRQEK